MRGTEIGTLEHMVRQDKWGTTAERRKDQSGSVISMKFCELWRRTLKLALFDCLLTPKTVSTLLSEILGIVLILVS
jgi:hypothetical protein